MTVDAVGSPRPTHQTGIVGFENVDGSWRTASGGLTVTSGPYSMARLISARPHDRITDGWALRRRRNGGRSLPILTATTAL